MKIFLTIVIALSVVLIQSTNISFGQSVTMFNTTVNQCSGNLLDPGGTGDYPNNNNTTTTICPGVAGASVRLNFTFFNTEAIFDNLTIYDGNTILGPAIGVFSGIIGPFAIQANNPTGCLTLVFSSDANFTSLGFNANIVCALPCQPVIAQVTSTTPISSGGFIDLCVGSTLIANGNGSYPSPAPVYTQSDVNSTFRWDFGDLSSATIQNTSHQYNTPGVFDLNLTVTDINGCQSTNDIGQRVRVSDAPSFAGTIAANNTICLGETNDLSGFAIPSELEYFCESSSTQDVLIPDGIGVPYSTTLNLDCFNPGGTITSASDVSAICFDIEHSYLHDLEIILTCPNGNSISLYDPAASGIAPINSVQLGEPVDNDLSSTFGTPYSYCFNMTATNNWFDVAEGVVGAVPTYSYIDNDGTPVINTMYIPAGDYLPTQSFANLIGCPMNGDWTITVIDQLSMDNGVVFDVSLDFNPLLYSPLNNYIPSILSNWVADPTITSTNGNTITVTPVTVGNKCYVYEVIDEFGCQFDTTICFDIFNADDGAFSYSQAMYCTNQTNATPTISGTPGGVFNATNGLLINPVNGTIDLANSTEGTYDISYLTPGLTGCPVSTTITIIINSALVNFSAINTTGCQPLTTTFTNLSPNSVNCVWDFGDGNSGNGCGITNHMYNNAGNFSPLLTVTDNNGCIATITQTNLVLVETDPTASFIPNPEVIPSSNQTVVLNNTSIGATNYTWIFANQTTSNATSPILTLNLQEGEEFLVKLYASSAAGCLDSTQQFLSVTPELIYYIPNSFTPNFDEFNTFFKPVMTQGLRKDSYNLRVYDRWGVLVFHSMDVNVGWDGTYFGTGKIAQDGLYTYQIDFLINNIDERKIAQGHVSLIR
jgi:gliding motility-associated-like protein